MASISACNILFVQLGNQIPPCLFTTIRQAEYFNPLSDIYLLVDGEAFEAIHEQRLNRIHIVNMADIAKTDEHLTFLKVNKIKASISKGFWKAALERFFYIMDFIKANDLKDCFHLENDCMLYLDLNELVPIFKILEAPIAAPFQSVVSCVPCFVYIKDQYNLYPFAKHCIEEMKRYRGRQPHLDLNDMRLLASFYSKYGNSKVTPLPILMPEYENLYSKRESIIVADNQTTLGFLSTNTSLFSHYLFDAAALGIFFNGHDRKYFSNNGPGTIHYRSLFDPSLFSYRWGVDEKNRKIPLLFFEGKEYRIVNIHFHSKKPQGYISYEDWQNNSIFSH